jgi:hypothetical protein
MSTQNLDYYRQRAGEELAAAERAADPAIAQIHREMAGRYRDKMNREPDRLSADARSARSIGGEFTEPGLFPA